MRKTISAAVLLIVLATFAGRAVERQKDAILRAAAAKVLEAALTQSSFRDEQTVASKPVKQRCSSVISSTASGKERAKRG